MKTYDKLKQLAPFVRQLLGAGAISAGTTALAAQSVAVTATVTGAPSGDPTVIIGATALAALSQTAAAIFGNRASDFYKDVLRQQDYGFNGDLQKAYDEALRLALNEVRDKYQRKYPDANHRQVDAFFESLQDYAHISDDADEVSMQPMLDAYIHNKEIFSGVLGEVLEVEPFSLEAFLLDFLVKEFPAALEHAFLAQLKEPEHERARVSFTIYLSEATLQLAKANGKTLAEVNLLLRQLAQAQRLDNDLQQEAYDKLRQLGYNLKQLDSKLDALTQKAAPNLPLSLPESDPRLQQHSFGFRARYTTFIGREKEMEQLETFFWSGYQEVRFRWMLVTGPGGAGKSRLALELCDKIREAGCHAGFLHVDHLPDLQKFEPTGPTLVVIDYVATHAEKVRDCIIKLYRRKSEVGYELRYPVRLLLLERDTTGAWWKDFQNKDEVQSCGFRPDDSSGYILPLPGFDTNERWAIIQQVYHKRTGAYLDDHRKEDILTELHRIDPAERPLFAFFTGSALADDPRQNLRGWNVHDLLDNLLQREKEQFWEPHEAYERREPKLHENLLALATLTQGLLQEDVSDLCEQIASEGKWLPEEPSLDLYKRMARIIADPDDGITIWEGLQPDLLGEYFLITRLQEWMQENPVKGKKDVIAFIQSAWKVWPAETRDFITKTLKDYEAFSGTETYNLLIQTRPLSPKLVEAWSEWGWLHVYSAYSPLTSTGTWSSRIIHYEILKQEAEQSTEETIAELITTRQAQAAVNLTAYFGKKEELATAQHHYQQIAELAGRFASNEEIATIQARAAFNLTLYFGKKEELATVQHYYQQIEQLAGKFASNEEIATRQAKVTVNLTLYFGKKGDLEAAKSYYQQLLQLAEKFASNEEIATRQAKAAFNLTLYFSKKGDQEAAESYYQQLIQLAGRFVSNEEIAVEQAKATVNLTLYFGKKWDREAAEGYYQQLVQLAGRFASNEEIAVEQAKATVNLTLYFGKKGNQEVAEGYYQQLVQLAGRFASNEEIAIRQARAAFNLTVDCGKKEELATVQHYYQQIAQLAGRFPTSKPIGVAQARAAFLLQYEFENRGDLTTAEHYFQQLVQLSERFPGSEEIAGLLQ